MWRVYATLLSIRLQLFKGYWRLKLLLSVIILLCLLGLGAACYSLVSSETELLALVSVLSMLAFIHVGSRMQMVLTLVRRIERLTGL